MFKIGFAIVVLLVALTLFRMLLRKDVSIKKAQKRFPFAEKVLSALSLKRVLIRPLAQEDLEQCEWTQFHLNCEGSGPEHDIERQCIIIVFDDGESATLTERRDLQKVQFESMLRSTDYVQDSPPLKEVLASEVENLSNIAFVIFYRTFDPFFSVDQRYAWQFAELLEVESQSQLEDWLLNCEAPTLVTVGETNSMTSL